MAIEDQTTDCGHFCINQHTKTLVVSICTHANTPLAPADSGNVKVGLKSRLSKSSYAESVSTLV